MENKNNEFERELEREAFNDILSHKYFCHGNCFQCGKEYAFCTNKKQSNRDFYCSDKCWKEFKKDSLKRKRERHHYQVFKDDKFYYIVVDGNFNEKRDFKGKTWMKKSEQDKLREENVYFCINNWKHPIISEKAKVPDNAFKIIDKISAFLYDEKHKFSSWSKLNKSGIPSEVN